MSAVDARAHPGSPAGRPPFRLIDSASQHTAAAILELVAARARLHSRGRRPSGTDAPATVTSAPSGAAATAPRGARRGSARVVREESAAEPPGDTAA
jgi:hypothetical protein